MLRLEKEEHYILVKGTISLETVTILSCGTSNNSLSELQKKKLDKPRIIADFSQLFILIDKIFGKI